MKNRGFSLYKAYRCVPVIIGLIVLANSCQSAEQIKDKEPAQQKPAASFKVNTEKPAVETTAPTGETASGQSVQKREMKKLIVYYFYTTYRCYSCHMIENLTKQAVETGFKDQIASGRMEFKALNIEEPAYKHYIKDYKLYTKSVVLSDTKDGKELRWKNLEQVWQLLRNENKFIDYVKSEVKAYLEG